MGGRSRRGGGLCHFGHTGITHIWGPHGGMLNKESLLPLVSASRLYLPLVTQPREPPTLYRAGLYKGLNQPTHGPCPPPFCQDGC